MGDRNVRELLLLSEWYTPPLPFTWGTDSASGWSGVGTGVNARGSGDGLTAGRAFSLSFAGVDSPDEGGC